MVANEKWFGGAGAGAGAFYDHLIEHSLFIPGGGTNGLNRTLGTPTNEYKLTLSVWLKRAVIGNTNLQELYKTFGSGGGANTGFDYITEDKLGIAVSPSYDGASTASELDAVFRDTSAFMHLVIAYDTTDGTATNRVKAYQNGTQLSGFTTTIPQNHTVSFNQSGQTLYIGRSEGGSYSLNGYIAELVIIDGQQLAPTSFGEEKNGVWKPIDPSGLTFGNNGAYLKFNNDGVGILPSSITSAGTHGATGSNIIGLFGNIGGSSAPSNYSQTGQSDLSFTVDLGSAKTVGAWLAQGHQSAGYATRTATGTVSYSDNNSDFTSVGSSTYTFANGTAPNGHTFTPSSHRYWKLSFPSASGGDGSSGYQLSAMYMQSAQSTSITDLGADSSGNGNNFSLNGISASNQVLDSPTFGSG